MPAKIVPKVYVTVIQDTSVNVVTLSLFKNNAAISTGINVAIPAGTVAGTKFTISGAGLSNFSTADDMDMRLDDPAGDAGGVVQVSVSVLYAC